jgi:hypothetical protein
MKCAMCGGVIDQGNEFAISTGDGGHVHVGCAQRHVRLMKYKQSIRSLISAIVIVIVAIITALFLPTASWLSQNEIRSALVILGAGGHIILNWHWWRRMILSLRTWWRWQYIASRYRHRQRR